MSKVTKRQKATRPRGRLQTPPWCILSGEPKRIWLLTRRGMIGRMTMFWTGPWPTPAQVQP